MSSFLFGPNAKLIDDLKRRVESLQWFSRIETPHPEDARIVRVSLEFLLERPTNLWNGATADAEIQIDRHIIDAGRLSEQYSLQRAFSAPWSPAQMNAVLDILLKRYPGYYRETYRYAYELLDFPERIIRYAFFECLVDDITPKVTFFRGLIQWFEQGYWPCGWQGQFPEGRIILL